MPHIKVSTNFLAQIVGLVLQGANQASGIIPPGGRFWFAIGVGAIQLVSAILGHYSNPNGTPASEPYVKQ